MKDNDENDNDELGYRSKTILSSKYEQVNVSEVARSCSHLPLHQRNELEQVLQKFPKLFNGQLGIYKGEQIHLEIDPNVTPSRTWSYPVPKHHEAIFKEESDGLVKSSVREPCSRAEWISGTFIIPKKGGRVRWVSDFRALNKALKRWC